jgi:hypothetical protein
MFLTALSSQSSLTTEFIAALSNSLVSSPWHKTGSYDWSLAPQVQYRRAPTQAA